MEVIGHCSIFPVPLQSHVNKLVSSSEHFGQYSPLSGCEGVHLLFMHPHDLQDDFGAVHKFGSYEGVWQPSATGIENGAQGRADLQCSRPQFRWPNFNICSCHFFEGPLSWFQNIRQAQHQKLSNADLGMLLTSSKKLPGILWPPKLKMVGIIVSRIQTQAFLKWPWKIFKLGHDTDKIRQGIYWEEAREYM